MHKIYLACGYCGKEAIRGTREAQKDFIYSDVCIGCMKKNNVAYKCYVEHKRGEYKGCSIPHFHD